jgi:hypothetical protein
MDPRATNCRSTKNYPNWEFWFENKPYGNPDPRDVPNYQMALKNILNGRKVNQRAIKYTNSSITRPLKINSIWDFWFENMPSGSPVPSRYIIKANW